MLFMTVYTYKPEKRDENIKRRAEKGPMFTGGKIIGEWAVIGGGTIFRLFEADDPKNIEMSSLAWTDLGENHIMPVMPLEDLMKLIPSKK